MIHLDNQVYSVLRTNYSHKQKKFAGVARGNTGTIIHINTGVFENRYEITLVCTQSEVNTLRTSFAKSSFTNSALGFTDEEGTSWLPTTGSDTSTTIYNSGVYFDGELDPKPMTPSGWNTFNRFETQIVLLVNANGSQSGGGGDTNMTWIEEVPGGTINGVNPTFVLSQVPGTAQLIRNGQVQDGSNYALIGLTFTFYAGSIPQTGDSLLCFYTLPS